MRAFAMLALGLFLLPAGEGDARADESDKARCASAYERAQELLRTEALGAARKQAVVCTETCPERLRHDCASWISDVDALMPTVVLRPHDDAGQPIRRVRATIDGELLAEDADPEKPLAIDPGTHTVRFEHPDASPAEVKVTVHGNERGREISITLWRKGPAPPPVAVEPAPPPSAHHRASAYVFGIGGLAALAAGGGIALAGTLKKSALSSRCAPFCQTSEADGVVTLWQIGGITAAVGAIALGIGTYLWFSPTKQPSNAAAIKPHIWPSFDGVYGTF